LGGVFEASKLAVLTEAVARGIACPATAFVETGRVAFLPDAREQLAAAGTLICKPDAGARSRGIAILPSLGAALAHTATDRRGRWLVQSYIGGDEYSILFVRQPVTGRFAALSAVRRDRLMVVGDGRLPLRALVARARRGSARRIRPWFVESWDRIPPVGERIAISRIGLRALGAEFVEIDPAEIPGIEALRSRLEAWRGLNHVRVDALYEAGSPELVLLEINGSLSEPLEAFAAGTGVWAFYRRFFTTYRHAFEVGAIAHRAGDPLPTRAAFVRALWKEVTGALADARCGQASANELRHAGPWLPVEAGTTGACACAAAGSRGSPSREPPLFRRF
jgi:hypothetical protein